MKKLGLVGGVGPPSTVEYYQRINEGYQKRLARPSKSGENPPMVIDSLNLAVAYELVEKKDWQNFAGLFINSIHALHQAGAEFAAISANTAHIVFDEIIAKSPIPLIGIVDETCAYAQAQGFAKVIVFGTGFTMASGMYEKKCREYNIRAIVPNEADRQIIHNIIFPNLEAGIVLEQEKITMLNIANKMLAEHQANALVLGCTELSLMIRDGDLDTILLDTAAIHIEAILNHIFS
ncbi:MAG: amino acid racemase [Clostridiales bacterium]|nr:amino acid racemase [Clostridiales bacterium]